MTTKKKKTETIWKKIGLPNPPDKKRYVLGSLKEKPTWIEVTTIEE